MSDAEMWRCNCEQLNFGNVSTCWYCRAKRGSPDWRSLCAQLAEALETVAAPLAINGPDHAAAVQHARDVLKDYAAATKTGQSAGGGGT